MKKFTKSLALSAWLACASMAPSAYAATGSLDLVGSHVKYGFFTNLGTAEAFWGALKDIYASSASAAVAYADVYNQFSNANTAKVSLSPGTSVQATGGAGKGWSGSILFYNSTHSISFKGIDGTTGAKEVGGTLGAPGPVAGVGLPAIAALFLAAYALRRREAGSDRNNLRIG